jgi:hypothetical protein
MEPITIEDHDPSCENIDEKSRPEDQTQHEFVDNLLLFLHNSEGLPGIWAALRGNVATGKPLDKKSSTFHL